MVVVGDAPVHLQVGVKEIKAVVTILVTELQKHVDIRTTGIQQHVQAVFHDRAFDRSLGRQQTDADIAAPTVVATRTAVDVKHSRRGTTILSRNHALEKRGTRQGVIIEGTEETRQMSYIVDRSLIIENGILGCRTTTHLKVAGGVALGLHARQQL